MTEWSQGQEDCDAEELVAKAEAHNRTAKLIARTARGFANPLNQARRVRMATTRTARAGTKKRKSRRSRKATGLPQPISLEVAGEPTLS